MPQKHFGHVYVLSFILQIKIAPTQSWGQTEQYKWSIGHFFLPPQDLPTCISDGSQNFHIFDKNTF